MHHHSMTILGRNCLGRRAFMSVLATGTFFATALPAHAQPTVTANDDNVRPIHGQDR